MYYDSHDSSVCSYSFSSWYDYLYLYYACHDVFVLLLNLLRMCLIRTMLLFLTIIRRMRRLMCRRRLLRMFRIWRRLVIMCLRVFRECSCS